MSNQTTVYLCREGAVLPKKSTEYSTGYDVFLPENIEIPCSIFDIWDGPTLKGCRKTYAPFDIPTGLILKPPFGYYFDIVLRSSTPKKLPGVFIPHGMGIIDSDYCGDGDEVKIRVVNLSENSYNLKKGERIAQLILRPIVHTEFKEITNEEMLVQKPRGGFGSTGL